MKKTRIGLNKKKKKTRRIGYPFVRLSLLARKTSLMALSATLKKKKKKTRRIRLCNLPEDILVKILSLLPTESAVATSILSRKWRYLWASVTILKLHDYSFKTRKQFINFTDRAMNLRNGSSLKLFSLQCRVHTKDASRVNAWITSAIQCNVEILNLYLYTEKGDNYYVLPDCLFDCQSLEILDLKSLVCILKVPSSSISVFPNLKCLKLYGVIFPDDESAKKLFSSPLLEELSIESCNWDKVKALRVCMPKLKVLDIGDYEEDIVNHKVCFVADNLWSFCYTGSLYNEYQICASSSSSVQLSTAKIVLHGIKWHPGMDRDIIVADANRCLKLISGLSKAHSLTLNDLFLEAPKHIQGQVDTLPIFKCLTQLNLECASLGGIRLDGIVLTKILERSPHLERLDIAKLSDDVLVVPEPALMCFRTQLKRIYIGDFTYYEGKEDAISVLLNSCAVLEIMEINRLTVRGIFGTLELTELLQNKLNGRPRVSKNCKIVLNYAHKWMCGCCRRVPQISMQ